jgi:hypothetical protein
MPPPKCTPNDALIDGGEGLTGAARARLSTTKARACLSASLLWVMTGCGTSFGIASPGDAGADNASTDDASPLDGIFGEDVASDAPLSDGDARDDVARDAARIDGPVDAPSDVTRDAARDENATLDGASDTSRGDAAIDLAVSDVLRGDSSRSDAPDADGPCIAESDAAFCARRGKNCEAVTDVDNCGAKRSANCGTCASGMGCVDRICKVPVCSSFTYAGAVYRPFSIDGTSDFAIATSAAGESVLYAQSPAKDCSGAVTYLADEITPGGRTYTSRDLSKWLDTNGVTAQALSGDGLTIVTISKDFRMFQSARRSALQLLDFGALTADDFAAVNAMLTGTALFRGGVLSADGVELFFTIFSGGAAIDGLYSAKRIASNVPFGAGSRLVGIDAAYTDVTGVSSDRLALFVFKPWAGFVFTRTSTTADFTNPNAPNAPPELAGWQHKPMADCVTLLATQSPGGGCVMEDILFQTRR